MAHYSDETLRRYEERISNLEETCLSEEEREINRLIIRIVRSARSTLWLINGGVKYLAAPIGFVWAIWAYGVNAADWIAAVFQGPR